MTNRIPILSCKRITKTFPGVRALNDVSFDLFPGEIHGIVGENGAGKSTLIKILCGVYDYDDEKHQIKNEKGIYFNQEKIIFKNPNDAIKRGIITIHQELSVINELNIYENIFINNEITKYHILQRKEMIKKAKDLLCDFGIELPIDTPAGDLPVDKQKVLELIKVVNSDARVIILDEPTSFLTDKEAQQLFLILKNIVKRNLGIIFISHNLSEITSICDTVTVLRDGESNGTFAKKEINIENLVSLMVGKTLQEIEMVHESYAIGEPLLEVIGLSYLNRLKNVTFKLNRGEILGITGLVGSGGSLIAKVIFGVHGATKKFGKIKFDGKEINIRSPKEAIKNGIALLTEDRKNEGLFLGFKIFDNITMPSLNKILTYFNLINRKKQLAISEKAIIKLFIKAPGPETIVEFLSGGNQQKVVIAKWLETDFDVLIVDEPTTGIDVAAKFEIRKILRNLAKSGKSIIMISNEFADYKALCDRLLIMFKGEIIADLMSNDIEEIGVMKYALGGKQNAS